MSSSKEQFLDFISIFLKPITAADRYGFETARKGNLLITILNSQIITQILLKDVLYAQKLSVTFVSISCLDSIGYVTLFCDLYCRIFNSNKKQLVEIPLAWGLYTIKAPRKLHMVVAHVNDQLTMEEIYCQLRHITPELIHQMLKDGVVEGLLLDPVKQPWVIVSPVNMQKWLESQ